MEWTSLRRRSATALVLGILGQSVATSGLAEEPSAVAKPLPKPAGVVRLSDQPRRSFIQQVSFDQPMSCTQCSPACTSGACANGTCANGAGLNGACPNGSCSNGTCPNGPSAAACANRSAGCQCAPGACHCGPNGCQCGAGGRSAALHGGYATNGARHCPNGNCQNGCNGCYPYKYNLYSFHDLGDDTLGWAGYDSGHRNDCHYPISAHCHGGCWLDDQADMFFARNKQNSDIFCAHIHGKFAYFTPMGNGGSGAPPFGHYNLVYAASPNYTDPRDSQLYAAQGWGVPMAVPLAPTVRHTMNYSAGMPASRLTPISNALPPRRRICR